MTCKGRPLNAAERCAPFACEQLSPLTPMPLIHARPLDCWQVFRTTGTGRLSQLKTAVLLWLLLGAHTAAATAPSPPPCPPPPSPPPPSPPPPGRPPSPSPPRPPGGPPPKPPPASPPPLLPPVICPVAQYLSADICESCTRASSGFYYTGHGGQADACPTAACADQPACITRGERLAGCGGSSHGECRQCDAGDYLSLGSCRPCTNAAPGFYYTNYSDPESDACPTAECLQDCPSAVEVRVECGGASHGYCSPCDASSLSPGLYFNSPNATTAAECTSAACVDLPSCAVGQYRSGCGGHSEGTCFACTPIDNQFFTSDGGLTDSCESLCEFLTCPAGYLRTGRCGDDALRSNNDFLCELCPIGEYCPAGTLRGTSCPAGRTTAAGAVSIGVDDCGCKASFYDDANGTCSDCPYLATECADVGITLATLPLQPGYWRASNVSEQVRLCKTASFCLGGASCSSRAGNATTTGNTTTTGAYCDGYCATGHTGPFCELCLDGFVKSGIAGCQICGGDLSASVATVTTIVTLILIVGLTAYCCHERQYCTWLVDKMQKGSVKSKTRILIALMQVRDCATPWHFLHFAALSWT